MEVAADGVDSCRFIESEDTAEHICEAGVGVGRRAAQSKRALNVHAARRVATVLKQSAGAGNGTGEISVIGDSSGIGAYHIHPSHSA